MTAFGLRSRGYQAGAVILGLATLLFVVGVVSPAWLRYERIIVNIREENFYAGVLVGCRYKNTKVGAEPFDFTRCSFGFSTAFGDMLELESMGGWVHAVETFEIVAAVGLVFACIWAALFNCFTRHPGSRDRIVEVSAGLSGLVAFIFEMVFVAVLRHDVERNVFFTFSWAYYLSVVSAIAAMVAAIIIALYNEYIPPVSDFHFSQMQAPRGPGYGASYAGSVYGGGAASVASWNGKNDAMWGTRTRYNNANASFYDDTASRTSAGRGGHGDDGDLDPRVIKQNYDGRNGSHHDRFESDL